MKNPLHYQLSEYDCGPTAMLDASAISLTGRKSYRELSEMSCFIVWTVMARKGFRERAALREQP